MKYTSFTMKITPPVLEGLCSLCKNIAHTSFLGFRTPKQKKILIGSLCCLYTYLSVVPSVSGNIFFQDCVEVLSRINIKYLDLQSLGT